MSLISDHRSSSKPETCSSSVLKPNTFDTTFPPSPLPGPLVWFGLVDSILSPIMSALQESRPRFQHLSCRRVRPRRTLHGGRLVRCRHHRNPPIRCVQNASREVRLGDLQTTAGGGIPLRTGVNCTCICSWACKVQTPASVLIPLHSTQCLEAVS
jgi:hypothetical protein